MMGSRSHDTEILVHVSGPSKASDDAIYRNIAQAYIDFEPERRSVLYNESQEQQPFRAQDRESASQDALVDFGHPLVAESQDLSFQSAIDNRSSPQQLEKHGKEPATNVNGGDTGADLLPSQISDSYPMPCQTLFKVSPARIFQTLLVSSRTTWDNPISSPSPKRRTLPQSPISDLEIPSSGPDPAIEKEAAERGGKWAALAQNIIPVTPFAAPQKPRDRLRDESLLQEPEQDEGRADVTHISSSFVSQVDHAPTQSTGEVRGPVADLSAEAPSITSPLSHLQPSSAGSALVTTSAPFPDHVRHALEIRPPSPPVTIDDLSPDDLIPPKLAKLSKDLASRYRPRCRRDVDPLERGYWLVDCSAWQEEGRAEAWTFLTQYIGCGLAGWGVWCQRDERREWIRLYCWGCVAKHTFLLLYLASGRRLKASGATWTDADGEMAVEVLGAHS